MTANLHDHLEQHFGFREFLPGQREAVECLLAGRSAAAVFPTGGGKSLCYQLPALLLPGLTLVVSPLIALMKDQIDALARRGIAAGRLDSSLSLEEHRDVMQRIRGGTLRLLYVAPERFNNERFREAIKPIQISLFAVDEAHCISEWGHNFRPDYLKLAGFASLIQAERILALTATATPRVLGDICRGFAIAPECAIRTGFYRPNLTLLTTPVDASQRDGVLLARLQERKSGPAIVYVTLQKTAERVAQRLSNAGLPARAYHAGMKDDQRTEVQDWFIASDNHIVVATIAFGMGIDKANIRYVYHYNLPKSLENYSQEIGRAGRDGAPATCELFAVGDDLCVLENFAYGDTPTYAAVLSLLTDVFSQGERFDVGLYELSNRHDIRYLVTRTLLTYLELEGYLQAGTPYYDNYQFQPRLTSQEILGQFDGARREFLRQMLSRSVKAKTWFRLDVDSTAAALHQPRERLVRALEYLHEQAMLEVRAAGVRNPYCCLRVPADIAPLADELFQRSMAREEREIKRLHQVLELVQHDGCQVARLCQYFGETLDAPCGHCTWCLGGHTPQVVPAREPPDIDAETWQQVEALRREHSELLNDPRIVARFLCGITSPRLTRAKLTQHDLFARLHAVPFRVVMQRAT
ncbi:MAG: RecQ family ATP-dependent DNA helicase [Nitrococcus sp.]|nr:RecQ family ATP-dependent DNA helicase [Nitrococcus sp.]